MQDIFAFIEHLGFRAEGFVMTSGPYGNPPKNKGLNPKP